MNELNTDVPFFSDLLKIFESNFDEKINFVLTNNLRISLLTKFTTIRINLK